MNWENLITTLVGGLLTLAGGYIQQCRAEETQKEQQIRQDKINIIKDITSSKTAILNTNSDNNAKTKFNGALNLIPIIFQDNEEILNAHKNFCDNLLKTSDTNSSNKNLYNLIMLMHEDVVFKKIPYEQFIITLSV